MVHINRSCFCRQRATPELHLGIKSPFNLHPTYFQGNSSETGANCSFFLPHSLGTALAELLLQAQPQGFVFCTTNSTTTSCSALGWPWEEKAVEWGCAKEIPGWNFPVLLCPASLQQDKEFQLVMRCFSSRRGNSRLYWDVPSAGQ